MTLKVERAVIKWLKARSIEYTVERNSRHIKYYVDGVLIVTLKHGGDKARSKVDPVKYIYDQLRKKLNVL